VLVISGMLVLSAIWWRCLLRCSPLLVACACGTVATERAARERSLAEARRSVERHSDALTTLSEVQTLARIVVERDLLALSDPHGPAYLEHVATCVPQVAEVLAELSTRGDTTGDAAQRMLIESGAALSPEEQAQHARSPNPTRRALAAAASVTPETWAFRRQAFADADVRVRRAALGAAARRPTESDVEVLHEVLRVDPDLVVRRRAALALGRLGETGALSRLEDLWPAASVEERGFLAEAWAASSPSSPSSRERLRQIALEEPGQVGALVAEHLARAGDTEGQRAAIVRLERELASGAEREQRVALRALARHSLELPHRIASPSLPAPSRLARAEAALFRTSRYPLPEEQRTELLRLARDVDAAALAATRALLLDGETSILPWHKASLRSPRAAVRRYAAQTELLVFLRTNRNWPLTDLARSLLDDAVDVRLSLGCLVLERD